MSNKVTVFFCEKGCWSCKVDLGVAIANKCPVCGRGPLQRLDLNEVEYPVCRPFQNATDNK